MYRMFTVQWEGSRCLVSMGPGFVCTAFLFLALSACGPTVQGVMLPATATTRPLSPSTEPTPPIRPTAIPVATASGAVAPVPQGAPTAAPTSVVTVGDVTPTAVVVAKASATPRRTTTDANILVDLPHGNDTIHGTIHVSGRARVFEAALSWALVVHGTPVLLGNTMTSAGAPEFGAFRFDIVPPPTAGDGDALVRVFTHSPRDGSVQDLVEIPIHLAAAPPSGRTMRIWFMRSVPNGVADEAVTRRLPDTAAVATAALQELVRGPSTDEVARGILAPLPPGTQLRSINISDGTARADFTHHLTDDSDAARRRAAFRAITLTLKEFSTVQNVVISVEGTPVSS